MSLLDALKQLSDDVDGTLACAVVDLNSSLMLGAYHNVPHFSQEFIGAVVAAAVDMFRGRTISTIEKVVGANRGVKISKSLKEAQITTDATYHFMATLDGKPDVVLLLITDHTPTLGITWTSMRRANAEIGPLCP